MGVHLLVLPFKMGIYRKRNVHGIGSSLTFAGVFLCKYGRLYPAVNLNYYPCQGQLALSMPNFNEASLSDTLQLVYSYKILWETGSLIPFCIGHYYNNQSSHQWLLLLRKKLPISLI